MTLSPEQLQLRAMGVGASEVAAIVGVSRYESPHDVWMRKVHGIESAPTSRTLWSTRLEDTIADWYAEHEGVALNKASTLFHPEYEWALCTPDRFVVGENRLIEIKARNEWARIDYGEPGTDRCSLSDTCQVMWQMFVVGLARVDLVVSFGDGEPSIYPVHRDESVIAELRERVRAFWFDYVQTGIEPPGTPGERLEALEARYPHDCAPLLQAPPEAEQWVERLRAARAAARFAADEEMEAKAALCGLIGEAEGLAGDGWRCTWKAPRQSVQVDWKAVAAACDPSPELIAQHSSLKASARRFLLRLNEEREHDNE